MSIPGAWDLEFWILFSSKKKLSPSVFMTKSHIHMPFDSLGIHFSSVAHSGLTLYNPMEYSIPGFPVLPYLLEFVQTHVHWGSDAIQPSYLLLPTSPLFLKQHQGLFEWVISSHHVAKASILQDLAYFMVQLSRLYVTAGKTIFCIFRAK